MITMIMMMLTIMIIIIVIITTIILMIIITLLFKTMRIMPMCVIALLPHCLTATVGTVSYVPLSICSSLSYSTDFGYAISASLYLAGSSLAEIGWIIHTK